jgi:hypothetical protein
MNVALPVTMGKWYIYSLVLFLMFFILFFFWWDSGLYTCKAGSLLLKPHLQT